MIVTGEQKAYYQQAEGELSVILSNFDTNFIYGTITDLIESRFNEFSLTRKSNYVSALESTFKDMMETYATDKENILTVRQETYKEIINILSKQTGLNVMYDESTTDLFTLAKCLYDLLVSEYDVNIFNFIYNFINTQKDYIYATFELDKNRKNKDISTLYNKSLYNDTKLAVINANLDYCIRNIFTTIDFNTEMVLEYMYYGNQKPIGQYLMNYIDESADLFKIIVEPMLKNTCMYASLSTAIKLEIQRNNINISDGYRIL